MKSSELQELRGRLEEELVACRQSVGRLEESAKPIAPDPALGRITRADGMNDQAVSSAALERNRERLYQLESTLDRMKRPGFGDCAVCGRPIPVERLLALPESTRCVACASR